MIKPVLKLLLIVLIGVLHIVPVSMCYAGFLTQSKEHDSW